jgi:hypothetical protein
LIAGFQIHAQVDLKFPGGFTKITQPLILYTIDI